MFATVVASDYFGEGLLGGGDEVSGVIPVVLFLLGVAAEDLPQTLLRHLSILGGLPHGGVQGALGAGTGLDEGQSVGVVGVQHREGRHLATSVHW